MSINKVGVTIQGVTPLLMHSFPRVTVEGLEKKKPEEQAEFACYRDPDTGGLYVPGLNIQRAMVSAASYSKGKGRSTLQRVAASCLMVTPQRVPLGVDKFVVDTQPVVVPATHGRILRHRPRLDKWEVSFEVEYDDTLLNAENVRRIIDDCGTRVGLLDFRPEKRGSYGRFVVIHWSEGEANGAGEKKKRN